MRFLIPLILLSGASLCFMAGYTVGKKSGHAAVLSDRPKAETTESQIRTASTAEVKTEPETSMETPPSTEKPSPELERFALRAEESIITLTDTQGRTLQGELLKTSEEHLNIRRQPDNQVLDVPVAMLSQEDQAFAAYLLNEGIKVEQSKPKLDSEIIWEELFQDM